MRTHDGIGAEAGVVREKHRVWRSQCGTPIHRGDAQAVLHHRLGLGEFRARVDAAQFRLVGFNRHHAGAVAHGQAYQVRQIVFSTRVIRPYLA